LEKSLPWILPFHKRNRAAKNSHLKAQEKGGSFTIRPFGIGAHIRLEAHVE
jgi:hypothetical protein